LCDTEKPEKKSNSPRKTKKLMASFNPVEKLGKVVEKIECFGETVGNGWGN
jgi:hypothetical protein